MLDASQLTTADAKRAATSLAGQLEPGHPDIRYEQPLERPSRAALEREHFVQTGTLPGGPEKRDAHPDAVARRRASEAQPRHVVVRSPGNEPKLVHVDWPCDTEKVRALGLEVRYEHQRKLEGELDARGLLLSETEPCLNCGKLLGEHVGGRCPNV